MNAPPPLEMMNHSAEVTTLAISDFSSPPIQGPWIVGIYHSSHGDQISGFNKYPNYTPYHNRILFLGYNLEETEHDQ